METELSTQELDHFWLIAQGHIAFEVLWTATQLGLFDLLEKSPGLSDADIADRLTITPYAARVLLLGLTAIKLIEKKPDGTFLNSRLASKKLLSNSESYVPILGWQHYINYKGMYHFEESIRSTKNIGVKEFPGNDQHLYGRLAKDPKLEAVFQNAMSALSKQANPSLATCEEFAPLRHVVDVGGGDGTNAMALVRNHPNLKVTIFDSQTVCERAKANVQKNSLSERVFFKVGNIFNDPLPKDIDAVLFCHMFTIFSPEQNVQLLKLCYQSLPKLGQALVFNMVVDDMENGPVATALGSAYFLGIASGAGMIYPEKDYRSWFSNAGFNNFKTRNNLPFYHRLFVGTK